MKTEVDHGKPYLEERALAHAAELAQANGAVKQLRIRTEGLVQREATLVALLVASAPLLEQLGARLRSDGDQAALNDWVRIDSLLLRMRRAAPSDPRAAAADLEREERRAKVVAAAADFVDADRAVDELEERDAPDQAAQAALDKDREQTEATFNRTWQALREAIDTLRVRLPAADPLLELEAARG